MNSDEFETILERERERTSVVALSLADPRERPATEDELHAFEKRYGYVLPHSYRHFALLHGCGHFVFAVVLSPLPESSFYIGRAGAAIRPDFLPIFDNGCGDFYCFPCEAGVCRDSILFADHERGYATSPTRHKDFFSFIVAEGLNANKSGF